mmetsp:Transcript_123906/g.174771  ORF Transcript_123906/g.174771 Transcript_123906/m.174771 type:complete len:135 (+) Transcript_123906:17-421(+)
MLSQSLRFGRQGCGVVVRAMPVYARSYARVTEGSKAYKSREQAAENKAIRERDRELLRKLKAKLAAENTAESDEHKEIIERLEDSVHDLAIPEDVLAAAKDEMIDADEFLQLRQELMSKVRDLEDQLAELRVKK